MFFDVVNTEDFKDRYMLAMGRHKTIYRFKVWVDIQGSEAIGFCLVRDTKLSEKFKATVYSCFLIIGRTNYMVESILMPNGVLDTNNCTLNLRCNNGDLEKFKATVTWQLELMEDAVFL